jgi:DNA-directed RNA polymerase subunit delta
VLNNTEQEKWQEVALVDLSYEVLNNNGKAMNYRDIFGQAAQMKGLGDEELMELLPQVYTEMNLDGRFICISQGNWGLRKWYSTESIEESVESLARAKGIDDDDDYAFEDEEYQDADEDEIFDDADSFDSLDDDDDEDHDEDEEEVDLLEEDEEVEDEFEDDEDEFAEDPLDEDELDESEDEED